MFKFLHKLSIVKGVRKFDETKASFNKDEL
jgi:hypothetical protein